MNPSPRDLYMQYMFGFFSAAGCKAIDPKRAEHANEQMRAAYSDGYTVGKAFQKLAQRQASLIYGYEPTIIRCAKTERKDECSSA